MDDRLRLEQRLATIEAQYCQLFDLLQRHNDINKKLELRLEKIGNNISRLGWYLAITLVGVVMSLVTSFLKGG